MPRWTSASVLKPPAYAEFDPSAALSKGLVFRVPFIEGIGVPLEKLTGKQLTPSSAIVWAVHPEGVGAFFVKGVTQHYSGTLLRSIANGPLTVVVDSRVDYRSSSTTIAVGSVLSTGQLLHVIVGGAVRFSLYGNDLDFTTSLADGDRHFIIARLDANKLQTLWLNGALVASQTATSFYTGDTTVTLGSWPDGTTNLGGTLTDIAVYDRVLTDQECGFLYYAAQYQSFRTQRSQRVVPSVAGGLPPGLGPGLHMEPHETALIGW
jgi:hypothetical protein